MASGVAANQDCITEFQQLKLGKSIKYIIYKLNDACTEIVVDKTSTSPDYDDFLTDLPETEPRWAVYDLEFEKEGAGKRNKICFFMWSPDSAKIKQKMVYASSKDALRKSLVGIQVDIQANEIEDAAYESVLDKANRGN